MVVHLATHRGQHLEPAERRLIRLRHLAGRQLAGARTADRVAEWNRQARRAQNPQPTDLEHIPARQMHGSDPLIAEMDEIHGRSETDPPPSGPRLVGLGDSPAFRLQRWRRCFARQTPIRGVTLPPISGGRGSAGPTFRRAPAPYGDQQLYSGDLARRAFSRTGCPRTRRRLRNAVGQAESGQAVPPAATVRTASISRLGSSPLTRNPTAPASRRFGDHAGADRPGQHHHPARRPAGQQVTGGRRDPRRRASARPSAPHPAAPGRPC